MTYSVGGLIQATDYNGFAATTAGANVNDIWGAGSSDKGYGQSTTLSTVSAAATVTATQWASLNSRISSMASHQGSTITSRTSPVAGDTIGILAALNTDLTTITTNRGNAAGTGTQYTSWSGTSSKTTATGSGESAWTITFTHVITFADANSARYFFNAGGRLKWECSKTSTGTDADDEWNNLANNVVSDIYITGGTSTQNIAGTNYTGMTRVGGSGTPTVALTTTGFYDLTTTPVTIYQQYSSVYSYTGQYIAIAASVNAGATAITLTTTWVDPGGVNPPGDNITGGTATSGITFGTAPATVVTYFPPSTTYLTSTWGTPTVAASVV